MAFGLSARIECHEPGAGAAHGCPNGTSASFSPNGTSAPNGTSHRIGRQLACDQTPEWSTPGQRGGAVRGLGQADPAPTDGEQRCRRVDPRRAVVGADETLAEVGAQDAGQREVTALRDILQDKAREPRPAVAPLSVKPSKVSARSARSSKRYFRLEPQRPVLDLTPHRQSDRDCDLLEIRELRGADRVRRAHKLADRLFDPIALSVPSRVRYSKFYPWSVRAGVVLPCLVSRSPPSRSNNFAAVRSAGRTSHIRGFC
jgi:hypothetical protein